MTIAEALENVELCVESCGVAVDFQSLKVIRTALAEALKPSHNISRDAIANAITEGIRNKEFSGEIADRVLAVIVQQHPC